MVDIKTVLCPVDFSDATERQVHFAVDLCRLFGARLVVHHNLAGVGTGAAVGWMWAATHPGVPSKTTATEKLGRLLAGIPSDVASQARLTQGLPTDSVLAAAQHARADLVVLTAHGGSHDEHMSLSEQVLERCDCAVLALHDASVDHAAPRFTSPGQEPQRVLVADSFSESSAAAVECAFDLARRFPVEVHLLHIEPARGSRDEPVSELADDDRRRLRALLPSDLAHHAQIHVAAGDPTREIAAAAERIGAALIMMGEHSRTGLWRWLSRDTGRFMLHHSHCPVWYVPAGAVTRRVETEARSEAASPA